MCDGSTMAWYIYLDRTIYERYPPRYLTQMELEIKYHASWRYYDLKYIILNSFPYRIRSVRPCMEIVRNRRLSTYVRHPNEILLLSLCGEYIHTNNFYSYFYFSRIFIHKTCPSIFTILWHIRTCHQVHFWGSVLRWRRRGTQFRRRRTNGPPFQQHWVTVPRTVFTKCFHWWPYTIRSANPFKRISVLTEGNLITYHMRNHI